MTMTSHSCSSCGGIGEVIVVDEVGDDRCVICTDCNGTGTILEATLDDE